MSREQTFSGRQGLGPQHISYDDAPLPFRHAVVGALSSILLSAETVITIVQRATALPRPDGFLISVAVSMIENCEWWRVFDVVEVGYSSITTNSLFSRRAESFEHAINDACAANNLGWRMVEGVFEIQPSVAQQANAVLVAQGLAAAGLSSSARELREAHRDLSRRPIPDVTGALQHAGVAVECLARELSSEKKATLGDIIKQHPELFPGAYRKVAEGVWGILSNEGRHLTEGGEPTLEKALFVVGAVTALSAYLSSGLAETTENGKL